MNARLSMICPNLVPSNSQVAICEKLRDISYGELSQGVENLAVNILKTGVTEGSRIGLCFDNRFNFVYGYLAILGAGCIPVLLSPGLPEDKLRYILADSGAAGMLCELRTFKKITADPCKMRFAFIDSHEESPPAYPLAAYSFEDAIRSKAMNISKHACSEWESDDLPADAALTASIIYTSGTTGTPKGVMISEENLLLATSAIIRHLELTSLDTCLVTMSFAHCAGLLHLLAHLRIGAKVVTGETFAMIGPFLGAIKTHGVTILPGVPSFYALLLKHSKHKISPYLKSVRVVESSSAMINSSLLEEIADIFTDAKVLNTYGLTEAPRSTYMAVSPREKHTNLSVGCPTSGVSIQVMDQNGQQCRPHEAGEIIINGPNLALGYWKKPEKTAASFSLAGFRTGDIGYFDSKGFLFLKGRKDDMIKVGAEAVYPQEIEDVVRSYPGIVDVLAYGVQDQVQGSAIHVKVVCKVIEINSKNIIDYCHEKLEKHKIPSNIVFCNYIALEDSGKPIRNKVSS